MGDNIEIGSGEVSKIRFVGNGEHPYAIGRGSIAIGRAYDHAGYFDDKSKDIAGSPRLSADGMLDIGCYEFHQIMGLSIFVR